MALNEKAGWNNPIRGPGMQGMPRLAEHAESSGHLTHRLIAATRCGFEVRA